MTEKRYKRLVSSIDYYYCIDTNDDNGLTEEDMLNRLNEQDKTIKKLEKENKHLRCTIESNSQDDYIYYLKKQNEKLKKELESFEQVSFTDLCDGSRTVLYMKKESGDSE